MSARRTFPSFLDSTGAQLFAARFPEGGNVDVTENFSLAGKPHHGARPAYVQDGL